jgi:hypothetical protein
MMLPSLRNARTGGASSIAVVLITLFVLSIAFAMPVLALYAGLRNTLDGSAIDGVVPTGAATIDQCRNPGRSFDLAIDVSNVNLPDGTSLTVTYGGLDGYPDLATPIGTFGLNGGEGHFATTVASMAGANDNLYLKNGQNVVLQATDRWGATKFSCS